MSDITTVRQLIHDTAENPVLTDEEIFAFLTAESSNLYGAANLSCLAISGIYASKADIKVGPLTIKYSQKSKNYEALAKSFRLAAKTGNGSPEGDGLSTGPGSGGVILTGGTVSGVNTARANTNRVPSTFYKGVHNG